MDSIGGKLIKGIVNLLVFNIILVIIFLFKLCRCEVKFKIIIDVVKFFDNICKIKRLIFE